MKPEDLINVIINIRKEGVRPENINCLETTIQDPRMRKEKMKQMSMKCLQYRNPKRGKKNKRIICQMTRYHPRRRRISTETLKEGKKQEDDLSNDEVPPSKKKKKNIDKE